MLFEMHQYDIKNVTITWQFCCVAKCSASLATSPAAAATPAHEAEKGLSIALDRDINIGWMTILKIRMKKSSGLELSSKEAR